MRLPLTEEGQIDKQRVVSQIKDAIDLGRRKTPPSCPKAASTLSRSATLNRGLNLVPQPCHTEKNVSATSRV